MISADADAEIAHADIGAVRGKQFAEHRVTRGRGHAHQMQRAAARESIAEPIHGLVALALVDFNVRELIGRAGE